MNPFAKRDDPHALVVGMTAVKMGDRLLQVGCAHGGRLAACAAKVGLSGRAVLLAPDEAQAARGRKAAADAGVLVEVEVASPTSLPFDDSSFDLVVMDDTGGLLGTMRPEQRVLSVRDVLRVLRPGGRALVIGQVPRGGIGAVFSRAQSGEPFTASGKVNQELEADGFKTVRTLAEREGLVFVEAMKARA